MTTSYAWDVGTGTWDGSSGADWNPPGDGTVPNSSSDVTVGTGGGGTVTLGQDQTVNSLTVTSGYTLTGANIYSITTNGNASVTGTGELILKNMNVGGTFAVGGSATFYGVLTAVGNVSVSGTLVLTGGTINDSTLTGAGTIETQPGSTGTLQADTIASGTTFTASNNATTNIVGTITNQGTIQLAGGGGSFGDFVLTGNTTLNGPGAVTMTDLTGGGDARFYGDGQTLTNNSTIQGTGYIGNGTLAIINGGTINANSASGKGALVLNGRGGITNTHGATGGLLEATGGGTLLISAITVNNANGNIATGDATGIVALVNNATVQGGTLDNTAGGTLETGPGNTGTLDGHTAAGAVTIEGIYTTSDTAGAGTATNLVGTITDNGTIQLTGGNGSFGDLVLTGNTTLNGSGTVTMTDLTGNGNARFYGDGQTLTNNITIQGTGDIGSLGSLVVINNATIDANSAANTGVLVLDARSVGVTNNNLLEATNGGTLQIRTTINNAAGNITGNGGTVLVSSTVEGGTLNTLSNGTIATAGTATLDGTTQGALTIGTGSTYTASDNATTNIIGTITDNGAIQLTGGNGSFGDLVLTGNTTLNGPGVLTMIYLGGNGNVRIYGDGQTLTNNATIQGTGSIGNGSLALVNSGTIDATPAGGTSTLLLDGSGGLTNTGTLEATNGGSLDVATALSGAGQIAVGAASAVELGVATNENANFLGASNSKFRIDNATTTAYTGTIGNFTAGEILELGNTVATSATPTLNGSNTTLTVNLNGGGTLTYTLAGNLTGDSFLVTLVNNNQDSDITIGLAPDDTPTETAPAAITATAGSAFSFTGANAVGVSDDMVNGETLTVTVAAGTGTLNDTVTTGVTGSGSHALTITGSLTQINAALAAMTYTGATGTTSDSITVKTVDSDGSPPVSKTIAVTVLAQDDTPTETAPGAITATAGSAFSFTGANAVGVSDDMVNGETLTVTVAAGTGTLNDTVTTGVTGSGSHALTITGSLTQINAALAAMTYTGATGTTSDSITVKTVDSDGTPPVSKTIAVTVTGPPTVAGPTSASVRQNQASAINGLSVAESGASATETFTVTLKDTNGQLAETATGTGATIGGQGTSTLTVTGTLTQVNAVLASVTDTEATLASDSITVNVTDSLGNSGALSPAIAVSVTSASGTPVITVPTAATASLGKALAIAGVSVAETPVINGETFTVTLKDSHGLLSETATGTGATVTGQGTTTLTLAGTLAQVDAALASLSDSNATSGPDPIAITASDSNGGVATPASLGVTVTGPPTVAGPTSASVRQNQASAINGLSVAESGASATETFTVTLKDTNGQLAETATGTGATIGGQGTSTLTVTGTLTQVNAVLASVTDTEATLASDSITVNVTDSLGNSGALSPAIAVSVTSASGTPVITVPTAATASLGKALAIAGVSVAETPVINGETFTVTLKDSHGLLSETATGTGATVTGQGTTTLTLAGTLAQVDAALASLSDGNATSGPDPIAITASDSNGGVATPASLGVTVTGPPTVAGPTSASVRQNQASAINGLSVAESGASATETFTVTLKDTNGQLAETATGTGATIGGQGTSTLTVTGTLTQVNAVLASVTDTEATLASDSITVNVTDSLGNSGALSPAIAVSVTPSGVSSWKNPVSGLWTVAGNWTPTGVPGPTSQVQINVPGSYAVDSTQNETVGSLTIGDPGAALTIEHSTIFTLGTGAPSSNAGTIVVDGQLKTIGALVNSNLMELFDGSVSGPITNTGSIYSGDSIDNTGTFNGAVTNSGLITSRFGGVFTFNSAVINSGLLTGAFGGVVTFNGAVTNTSTGLIDDRGISNAGVFDTVTFNGAVTNAGSIAGGFGGIYTFNSATTNSGSIAGGFGSIVTFNGAVTGVGTELIQSGSETVFNASVSSGQTIDFGPGSETLILDQAQTFAGTVAGLGSFGDEIDLANFKFASKPGITGVTGTGAAGTTTNVTVTDGALNATLHLLNQFANEFAVNANAYSLTSDNPGTSSAGTLFGVDLAPAHPPPGGGGGGG